MPCYAVFSGFHQMEFKRTVGDALTDERSDCHKAAVAKRQQIVAAPDFAEKHIVVKMCELRGEVAERIAPRCLYDFYLCHYIKG